MTDSAYFDPEHTDVKKHAASGFFFSTVMQVVKMLTQFLSVIVMARLLTPTDFGLIAMVGPVYSFAMIFSDLGISQATMQKQHITSAQMSTFFWINVGMGAAICLALSALSPLVGMFYHDERTVALTIAMSLLVFMGSLGNQHGSILIRQMNFREQTFNHVVSDVAGVVAAVACGYFWKSYWALYVGMLVPTLFLVGRLWWAVKWRPSVPAIAPETKEMLTFGMGITGGNFTGFLVQSSYNVIIGRVLGDVLLGLYDRASRLLSSPLNQLVAPIGNVMSTMLFRLQDDPERYRRTFLRTLDVITLAVAPGVVWAVVLADELIPTLLGKKWEDATAIFIPLSLAALPQLVNGCANWLFKTQGRGADYARWSLVSAGISIVFLVAGLPFGILGVAYFAALSQFLRTPILWIYACRGGPVSAKDVLKTLGPQSLGCALSALALFALHQAPALSPLVLLILGIPLSYAAALAVVACFPAGRASILNNLEFARYLVITALQKAKRTS